MDRRHFIGSGTASALGLAGASAAVPAARLPAQRQAEMPADINEYLARIDAASERIGQWSTAEFAPNWTGDRAEADALARTALQSLLITGMIADLPVAAQMRPEVQQRIHSATPLIEEAMERTTSFLKSRTAADLQAVQVGLRDYGAGARILGAIDRRAGASGLSDSRRAQTREIFAQTEFRLRHQPPGLIVGEYLDKVEKLAAADLAWETRRRAFAAQFGEAAFWLQAADKTLRQRRISRSLKQMGFGVLALGGGYLIVSAGADVGLFIMTVGAVTLIIGLLTLLVGVTTPVPKP